tara:strand:- start:3135 stop:3311 length:177 start_codon:yes stop_codon:yes gene_type:complete
MERKSQRRRFGASVYRAGNTALNDLPASDAQAEGGNASGLFYLQRLRDAETVQRGRGL